MCVRSRSMPQTALKAPSMLDTLSTVVTKKVAAPTAPKLLKFTFFTVFRMYSPASGLPAATSLTSACAIPSLAPSAPSMPMPSARIGISDSIAKYVRALARSISWSRWMPCTTITATCSAERARRASVGSSTSFGRRQRSRSK
jgi:hypothetical protein